jgi:hypothetical protein
MARTITFGGQSIARERITENVTGFTLAQVQEALRRIAVEVSDEQTKLGNPPSTIQVDNSSFKTINQAERRIVVTFGTTLVKGILVQIETILRHAIDLSTTARSGRLHDIAQSWEWVYVPGFNSDKTKAGVITNPEQITSFGFTDRLILRPKLAYATAVNMRVAGGSTGALNIKTRGKRGNKGAANFQSRRLQNMGFLGYTAETLRRNPQVRNLYSVYVAFSKRFTAPGEVSKKQGTGVLIIRPKRRGRLN